MSPRLAGGPSGGRTIDQTSGARWASRTERTATIDRAILDTFQVALSLVTRAIATASPPPSRRGRTRRRYAAANEGAVRSFSPELTVTRAGTSGSIAAFGARHGARKKIIKRRTCRPRLDAGKSRFRRRSFVIRPRFCPTLAIGRAMMTARNRPALPPGTLSISQRPPGAIDARAPRQICVNLFVCRCPDTERIES